LSLWGLNGAEACAMIRPYLAQDHPAIKIAAIKGLANCRDTESFSQIVALAKSGTDTAMRSAALKALAFTAPESARNAHVELVAAVLAGGTDDAEKAVALYGLMQSITYSGLSPTDLTGLDFELLLRHAGAPDEVGMQAAYLLSRIAGLNSVYTVQEVMAAITGGAMPAQQYILAARVLPQFGDAASGYLVELASSDDPLLATSALRGFGLLSDAASMAFLNKTLGHADPAFRSLAVTALAARDQGDAAITAQVVALTNDENPWVSVTALRGLMQRAPDQAVPAAKAWIAGDNYYQAFVALGMLAQSDEGKAFLQAYADANPETIRGREAAIALDPSIEAIRQPRKTPSASLVQSYMGRQLVLQTTRGLVCIAPLPDAPFAAANFMLLADAGKMDGMLWHRVIPNFVTQAGQSEDFSLSTWGTIREEWGAPSHEVGTVGVATAGPDTGSAQFFINTAHNLHLDGRYTVFGKVTEGMPVVYALQEGDVIEKAETLSAGSICN
jgi:cyclophilin family peptidyl-prolyl cis-trans isomerase